MSEANDENTPRAYLRTEGGRFSIAPAPLALMHSFRQDTVAKLEAGGVLLGRHVLDSADIIVDQITVPHYGDRQERTRFYRARRHHQQIINRMWRETQGTCTYLGEWHTHPEVVPNPSVIDEAEWLRKLRNDEYTPPVFFIIVGVTDISVWEGQTNGVITRLSCL